jgi:hypothetical protein
MNRSLLCLPLALFAHPQDPSPGGTEARSFEVRSVCGFEVRLTNGFADHPLCGQVMDVLHNQLYRTGRVVADEALAKIRTIPIWVGFEDPRQVDKCMAYHPNPRWLEEHGYPTELAGCVEVANAKNFLSWTLDQPWMLLHELAHGYHHQFLGYGNQKVRAAFEAARKGGGYEEVLHINGSRQRHYALTNVQEYFAEASEAYFGTNDFFPFVRSELRHHDPVGFAMLETVYGKRRR